ncbi:MAG TPA: hypothetical protein DDX59_03380 [Lachnospiraceae bacterium]|nr:hypothetical protein [Lachnospiraceae bacterium]HAP72168.1 hypothetical protein [Lachnospiraceae bacterium]HBH70507.1 hypothetical protein [Lachnospiraceae bacterium]
MFPEGAVLRCGSFLQKDGGRAVRQKCRRPGAARRGSTAGERTQPMPLHGSRKVIFYAGSVQKFQI